MKILHIIGTLDPKAGGPAQSVRVLLSYGSIGYIGEVVTLDDPSAPFLKDLPFPVHPMGPTGNYGYTGKLVPWLKANHHRFDGIVVNGVWQYCGLAALRALRNKKTFMVFTHGMLDPYFKRAYPLKHIKKAIYWYLAEYWVLRSAFRVLFTTQMEADLARKSFMFHTWKEHVVPYGTSGPPIEKEEALAAFYNAVPQAINKRFLLFLGRIHQKKGCDLLIEAFAKIAGLDPDLHLIVAGPDQQGLQKELDAAAQQVGIADRILWPGMITGAAKWGALYACEAFVLPSHQENFGIAVAEALSCSKPVLISNQVNIAPEIANDNAGFVEPDTADGTLRLLERWLAASATTREAMSVQALHTFHQRYDMKETARTIISLFEKAKNK